MTRREYIRENIFWNLFQSVAGIGAVMCALAMATLGIGLAALPLAALIGAYALGLADDWGRWWMPSVIANALAAVFCAAVAVVCAVSLFI